MPFYITVHNLNTTKHCISANALSSPLTDLYQMSDTPNQHDCLVWQVSNRSRVHVSGAIIIMKPKVSTVNELIFACGVTHICL